MAHDTLGDADSVALLMWSAVTVLSFETSVKVSAVWPTRCVDAMASACSAVAHDAVAVFPYQLATNVNYSTPCLISMCLLEASQFNLLSNN